MGTDKRARQKANRQARLQAAIEEQTKAKRKRTVVRYGAVVAVALAFFLIYSLVASSDDDTPVETASTGAETTPASDNGAATTSTDATPDSGGESTGPAPVVLPEPGASIAGETPCPAADGSSERTTDFAQAPPNCIDATKTYRAEVATNVGSFTVELDAKRAPLTVNNFVVLSRYHFYDGVPVHRVVPGFVAQAGGGLNMKVEGEAGTGGPGYSFADELPDSEADYVPGSLAMANSGPDTNGSQFFVYVGPNPLTPANYSLFGKVVEGFDEVVVGKIMAAAVADAAPTTSINIESITITEA
ncbi:MAG: peptidylprolyl isomerase [Acidimicrobiia bacterium]|nr:peptidylprolyl isomerase [Acidimicrobiia bacterium]